MGARRYPWRRMDSSVMRRIRAFASVVLAVVAFVFGSVASASFPATVQYRLSSAGYPALYATAVVACQTAISSIGAPYAYAGVSGNLCLYTYNGGAVSTFDTIVSTAPSCPANSTLSGGQCTCTSPYTQNAANNACLSPAQVDAANCKGIADALNIIGAPLVHFGPVGVSACYGGYTINGSGGAGGSLDGVASQSEVYGPFSCPSSPSPCTAVPKPAGQTQCQPGEYPGTVNGVSVCAPSSNTNTVQSPKTTTVAPTTAGQPAPVLEGAPAGATSKTESTSCIGAKCTTTTTFKNAAGEPLGTETKETTKGSECEKDPAAPGCTPDKSKFSGTCIGGFVGTGDALQKATAEAVNKTNCLLDPGTSLASVSDALVAGTFGPELTTTTRALGQFDQSNPLGSTCPPDLSLTIMSATVVIPLSQACWALQALGYIAVAFTLLYSTIFVVKGF